MLVIASPDLACIAYCGCNGSALHLFEQYAHALVAGRSCFAYHTTSS